MTGQDTDHDRARPVDIQILETLLNGRDNNEPWGRDTPERISDTIDVSSQHTINRLNVLEAAGHVRKLARGLYEITDDGIELAEEH